MDNRNTAHRYSLALATLLASQSALAAPEYIESEQPPAGGIDATIEPMEFALRRPAPARVFRTLRDTLRQGSLDLQLRNYYFDRYRENQPDSEAWAQGGWLGYDTPWWKHRLRLGVTLYTSQKLYGPQDKDGTLLLKPGQDSFSVLGEAFLEAQPAENIHLKLYRQTLSIPYLNRQDSRMIPNTFEGLTLIDTSRPGLAYGFGQLQRIKTRNSSRFESMTEAAGIEDRHRGVSVGGVHYSATRGFTLGAFNLYGWDFMNTAYAEVNSRPHTEGDWDVQFSAQYTDQRAVGDELAGDFDTHSYGVKAATSYLGLVATLAYTSTANNAGIRSPWGGKPSYLSLMVEDFDRAGEDAWLVGLSSDFSSFGDNGFSAFVNYARGDTPESGRTASPDQSELDITVDYRFRDGVLKGLWIRARSAYVDRDGDTGDDVRDHRVILNYAVPLF